MQHMDFLCNCRLHIFQFFLFFILSFFISIKTNDRYKFYRFERFFILFLSNLCVYWIHFSTFTALALFFTFIEQQWIVICNLFCIISIHIVRTMYLFNIKRIYYSSFQSPNMVFELQLRHFITSPNTIYCIEIIIYILLYILMFVCERTQGF